MKTQISAKLVLASHNLETGNRLYTMLLTYPRFILSEANTHRAWSRNTSSSRAIPAKKLRAAVLNDPFIPLFIGKNQKGMQAGERFTGSALARRQALYGAARYPAVAAHWLMEKLGVHKEITNRLIEPWQWTQQLVSATDWNNFLRLRNHDMAEPHMHDLAGKVEEVKAMADVLVDGLVNHREMLKVWGCEMLKVWGWKYVSSSGGDKRSNVRLITPGGIHLPFITPDDQYNHDDDTLKKISAARCARTSYTIPETGFTSTVEDDLTLYERLATGGHLSPLEHVATAISADSYVGNFRGFRQFRKEHEGEDGGDRVWSC